MLGPQDKSYAILSTGGVVMFRQLWPMVWCFIGALIAHGVGAQDNRPLSPEFNPFSRATVEDSPRDRDRDRERLLRGNEDAKSSGFSWPSLPKPSLPKPKLPNFSLPLISTRSTSTDVPKRKSDNEPGVWEKMNRGTKSLYTKTKQTLMPWAEPSKDERTANAARRPIKTSARSKAKPESKSFFSSWFTKEEDEKPMTVNDYLSLPRVPFE
jgi:hypothetical protein